MSEIACLGILVADVYGKPIDGWPQRGRLSLVPDMGMGLGGCAANTGLALVRLGVDTAVMGKVGDDGFGAFVRDALEQGGAHISGVKVDPDVKTSATMVIIDSEGERTFIHYVGANATVTPEDIDMDIAGSAKIFHCAGALVMPGFDGQPMAQVLKEAKARGTVTALDTVWDDTGKWMDTLAPCLEHTQIFLPSLSEARELTNLQDPPEVAKALIDRGVEIVGLKIGPNGSYIATCEGGQYVPTYKINAVDGTGAGDAFVAGFLCAYLKGWDLERTAKFASAVGALCTTGLGTTAGLRDFDGTLEFLADREPQYWADL